LVSRIHPTRVSGPNYDPTVFGRYQAYLSAISPKGFLVVGSRMYLYNVLNPAPWGRIVMVDDPELPMHDPFNNTLIYPRATPTEAFPTLGVVVATPQLQDSVFVVDLSSTYPTHQRFERRVQGGSWEVVSSHDVLPVGHCRVEYRSIDALGTASAVAVLDVWAPRTEDFVLGRQTRLCF
jgi:hypothetical protein